MNDKRHPRVARIIVLIHLTRTHYHARSLLYYYRTDRRYWRHLFDFENMGEDGVEAAAPAVARRLRRSKHSGINTTYHVQKRHPTRSVEPTGRPADCITRKRRFCSMMRPKLSPICRRIKPDSLNALPDIFVFQHLHQGVQGAVTRGWYAWCQPLATA